MPVRLYDDVVEIIKPDPDSQYRLRACDCGNKEVVYARDIGLAGPGMWRVVCPNCRAMVDLQGTIQHDVQVEWNRRNNRG